MSIKKENIKCEIPIRWDVIIHYCIKSGITPLDLFYWGCLFKAYNKDEMIGLLYGQKEKNFENAKIMERVYNLNISNFYITKRDLTRLQDLEIKYLHKTLKLSKRDLSKYLKDSGYLDTFTPSTFKRKPKWAKYDHAYLVLPGDNNG